MAAIQYLGGGTSGGGLTPGVSNIGGDRSPAIANLGSNSTTTRQYDSATQNFINQLLGNVNQQNFNVQDYTKQALQNLTQNPGSVGDLAGQNMQQIIRPLLDAQQEGFRIQNRNASDMFRRAGVGTQQGGAYGQTIRQLAADQGRQQQQLIAGNYVPLLNNATQTIQGSIDAGLRLPGSESAGQAGLSGILGILANNPKSTSTTNVQQQLVPGSTGSVGTAR